MAEESAKLRIPYIAAAQAQKHVTHNEGMTLLDTLVQLSVLDKDLSTPPGSPAEGDTYIVAAGATGAWIGWDNRVVRFIDGTWRSYLPGQGDGAGWLAYVIDESTLYVFTGAEWEQLFVAGGGAVDSVNGVVPVGGDVSLAAADIPVTPAGGLAADDVQEALEELDSDIGDVASDLADHEARTDNPHAATKSQVGLGNVSDDAQLKRGADDWSGFSDKATPADADLALIEDSAASGAKKKLTWANVKATLKTYFDTLYGRLASANTWSAAQTISVSSGTPLTLSHPPGNAMSVTASGAAAGGGPIIILYRDNPSAANGDGLGQFTWLVKDASGNPSLTAQSLTSTTITATAGAVSTRFGFTTRVSGTNAQRMALASGLVVGSPTGGDQGVGTINAVGVYDDSVLLTSMPLAEEFSKDGAVDLAKWDALAPDMVIQAGETGETVVGRDADGQPIIEKQIVAATRIKRRHEAAHHFKAMLDSGFDPRDPDRYFAKLKADRILPGMPTPDEMAAKKFSLGEIHGRTWLTMDMMGLILMKQNETIEALKAEIEALKAAP